MSIDPRLMERRKTVAEDNAKRSINRLLKFLLLIVAAGALVWLLFSPWLSISQVTATGVEQSDTHAVLVDHRVTAGTPMILISAPAVEESLLRDPWVAEAELMLRWPNQVTVDIVERFPVAWARRGDGWTRRAIDGVALPSAEHPDDELPRIDMPGIGDDEATDSTEMLGALEFVANLDQRYHPGTAITFHEGEIWATVAGFQVRLGRADAMAEKALSLGALLQQDIPEGSTLVLLAPTNPAVMTPQEEPGADDDERPGEGEEGEGGSDDDS
jgi:hypothetical protein